MVDKNLFPHDLAVVAILKNEGHYLKEWLDYHLMAGVDHFYLYDNDSPDNQAEVAKPYVEAGLVDYFHAPGKFMQYVAYNDAVKRFKFHCRYMAIIDCDEFIYPRSAGGGVIEVVDEILSKDPTATGLSIHWQSFGSNGETQADYSRGVLERFTRRAPRDWGTPKNKGDKASGNYLVKTISDPRRINYIYNAHLPAHFDLCYAVDENGRAVIDSYLPIVADKIAINHYFTKSWEEYTEKSQRGRADTEENPYDKMFKYRDRNEVFDDGILKYRDARAKIYQPPDKSQVNEKILVALMNNLQPTLRETPPDFYAGKMETFLTCRALCDYLKNLQPKIIGDDLIKFCEETSLIAILKSIRYAGLMDARLFVRELPNLLNLPYPAAKKLRGVALQIIPQLMNLLRDLVGRTKYFPLYREYVELDYIRDLLKIKE